MFDRLFSDRSDERVNAAINLKIGLQLVDRADLRTAAAICLGYGECSSRKNAAQSGHHPITPIAPPASNLARAKGVRSDLHADVGVDNWRLPTGSWRYDAPAFIPSCRISSPLPKSSLRSLATLVPIRKSAPCCGPYPMVIYLDGFYLNPRISLRWRWVEFGQ